MKTKAFVAKIANKRLTKHCVAIFALAKRLPTSATLEEAERFISLSVLHFLVYIQVLYKPGMAIIDTRYPTDPIKMSIRRGSEAKWDSCKAFSYNCIHNSSFIFNLTTKMSGESFLCEVCSKSLAGAWSLKYHLRTHTPL